MNTKWIDYPKEEDHEEWHDSGDFKNFQPSHLRRLDASMPRCLDKDYLHWRGEKREAGHLWPLQRWLVRHLHHRWLLLLQFAMHDHWLKRIPVYHRLHRKVHCLLIHVEHVLPEVEARHIPKVEPVAISLAPPPDDIVQNPNQFFKNDYNDHLMGFATKPTLSKVSLGGGEMGLLLPSPVTKSRNIKELLILRNSNGIWTCPSPSSISPNVSFVFPCFLARIFFSHGQR